MKEDPTSKQKARLIKLLRNIKAEGGITEEQYKKIYPTGAGAPKFYGLPKIHKQDTPLRPIVSSIGTASYNTAKELAKILKPLVGKSQHHLQNTKDFIQQIKDVKLQQGETIISYDVKALFTSVPIQPVLNIIKNKLEDDQQLQQRTSMSVSQITSLLEYCLRNTYFVFQGEYYEQLEGAAMGSPLSPIIANMYMEEFEIRALSTSPNPPTLWKRFVDDTFVVIQTAHKEEFFQHINSLEGSIQFTAEDIQADGSLPFLDVLVTPQPDGTLKTSVYRKPTHTNQYLQWDSHHSISAKYSVISTLYHRAKEVCSTGQQLKEEQEQIKQALTSCKYPYWALDRVEKKTRVPRSSTNQTKKQKDRNTKSNTSKTHITVTYSSGLSDSFKNICKKYGIQVYFRGGKTIRNLLVAPKDREHITQKSGIVYRFKCDRVECDDEYIGESARTFGERFKEHLKCPSPIYDHSNNTGHSITLDNFSIVGREEHNLMRLIKEAIFIRVNNPSLNKNRGKYHLPHIWDEVLNDITELKLN